MDLILKIKCEEMPWLVCCLPYRGSAAGGGAAVPRPLLQQQAVV